MVTQPAPVDRSLTVHREATLRQLAEHTARLLEEALETPRPDERAYADLLAASVRRVADRTCWVLRSAIHPSEQTRILAAATPWLHEIRVRLEERARSRTDADNGTTTRTVITEWVFDDAELTRLVLHADRICAETVAIDE